MSSEYKSKGMSNIVMKRLAKSQEFNLCSILWGPSLSDVCRLCFTYIHVVTVYDVVRKLVIIIQGALLTLTCYQLTHIVRCIKTSAHVRGLEHTYIMTWYITMHNAIIIHVQLRGLTKAASQKSTAFTKCYCSLIIFVGNLSWHVRYCHLYFGHTETYM